MSSDLWDLSERAESLVSKINFQGMTQDEVIGLFYQEFCKPTVVEKQYDIKLKWMLDNGFEKENVDDEEVFVYNKDFYWTKEDIKYNALSEIKEYVKLYNDNYKKEEN